MRTPQRHASRGKVLQLPPAHGGEWGCGQRGRPGPGRAGRLVCGLKEEGPHRGLWCPVAGARGSAAAQPLVAGQECRHQPAAAPRALTRAQQARRSRPVPGKSGSGPRSRAHPALGATAGPPSAWSWACFGPRVPVIRAPGGEAGSRLGPGWRGGPAPLPLPPTTQRGPAQHRPLRFLVLTVRLSPCSRPGCGQGCGIPESLRGPPRPHPRHPLPPLPGSVLPTLEARSLQREPTWLVTPRGGQAIPFPGVDARLAPADAVRVCTCPSAPGSQPVPRPVPRKHAALRLPPCGSRMHRQMRP